MNTTATILSMWFGLFILAIIAHNCHAIASGRKEAATGMFETYLYFFIAGFIAFVPRLF